MTGVYKWGDELYRVLHVAEWIGETENPGAGPIKVSYVDGSWIAAHRGWKESGSGTRKLLIEGNWHDLRETTREDDIVVVYVGLFGHGPVLIRPFRSFHKLFTQVSI